MIASNIDQTELAKLLDAIPNGREIVISRQLDGIFIISRMVTCEPIGRRLSDYWYANDNDGGKQAASTVCLSIFEAEQEVVIKEMARRAKATHQDIIDKKTFYRRVTSGLEIATYKDGELSEWRLSSRWFYPPEHSVIL